jgi:hypothetical protein
METVGTIEQVTPVDNLAIEFAKLFQGNPNAHYVRRAVEYQAVERAIEAADFQRHLAGIEPGLLSIPINRDGKSHFAAGDVDRHKDSDPSVDHVAVALKITEMGLPLIITRSKSPKSAHIWLFFKEPDGFNASKARQLIQKYMPMLGLYERDGLEVFPKQVTLELKPVLGKDGKAILNDDGTTLMKMDLGSGINLPYFGDSRIAFGKDGEELDLPGFIALVRERQSYGDIMERRDLADVISGHRALPVDSEDRPLTIEAIRDLFQKELQALRDSNTVGGWDTAFNTVCFTAGRAFAVKALLGDETAIKAEIRAAAATHDTCTDKRLENDKLNRSWADGIAQPFKIRPAITDPQEIVTRDEAFCYFDEHFFVVEDFGGHCRVMWLHRDDAFNGRMRIGHQSFEEFKSRFSHLHVKETVIGKKGKEEFEHVPIADCWLYNKKRRQYRTVAFAPGETLDAHTLNLWNGFSVQPQGGPEKCKLFLAHLKEVICDNNEELSSWLVRQMAYWIQKPGEPGHVAVVLRCDEGGGKNSFVEYFGELWGQHFLTVGNAEHLVGRFNKHLMDCSVCLANEAFLAENKQHESTLKIIVTDDALAIEAKGVDLVQSRNRIHLFISSNSNWVVPAGLGSRRFAVFNVSEEHMQDHKYFKALKHEKDHQGKEALLNYLMHLDVSKHNPRLAPKSVGLDEQKRYSLKGIDDVWYEILQSGEIPGIVDKDGCAYMRSGDLVQWALRRDGRRWSGLREVAIGMFFRAGSGRGRPGMNYARVRIPLFETGTRDWAYKIPTLAKAREDWDSKRFKELDWNEAPAEAGWQQAFVYEKAA